VDEQRSFDLGALLKPSSIAVVGASERLGPGRQVIENLQQLGYQGDIYPVNPNHDTVLGFPCYRSLKALHDSGHSVDMAAILLGRESIIPVLEEAAEIGVRAAWAFASGFAEADALGEGLQRKLETLCRRKGIAFCGPNCVGYLNPTERVGTYSAPVSPTLRSGCVGAVAQSGSVCLALANSGRGIGYSLLVSSGNEAVVDSTDYIDYMLDDPQTTVVLAFIEQFRRPQRLLKVAKRAWELGKPLIVLKVGRSKMAQQATIAHTGALAGTDAIYDAVFRKYGIIRVDSLDEMLETAAMFSHLTKKLPRGNNVGMITVSGGEIGLIGDLAEGLNLEFPPWSAAGKRVMQDALPQYSGVSNPLDAWGSGNIDETYPPCIKAAVEEEQIDIIVISQDAPPGIAPLQVSQYAVVADAAVEAAKGTRKPIVAINNLAGGLHPSLRQRFEDGGIPFLQGTQEGLQAISHLVRYVEWRKQGLFKSFQPTAHKEIPRLQEGEKALTEYESKRILAEYGLTYPREILCSTVEEALTAAQEIGYPVVVKAISSGILHKTEAGVVRLNVSDAAELERAYHAVLDNATRYAPEGSVDGVLVQQMMSDAVAEIIVGVMVDPGFGPAVVFGLGGKFVELLKDRVLGIPPFTEEEVEELISTTKARRLLRGFRNSPPGDTQALVQAIIQVGNFALDWKDRIRAVDINPLLVLPRGKGVVAVDALIEMGSVGCKKREVKISR